VACHAVRRVCELYYSGGIVTYHGKGRNSPEKRESQCLQGFLSGQLGETRKPICRRRAEVVAEKCPRRCGSLSGEIAEFPKILEPLWTFTRTKSVLVEMRKYGSGGVGVGLQKYPFCIGPEAEKQHARAASRKKIVKIL